MFFFFLLKLPLQHVCLMLLHVKFEEIVFKVFIPTALNFSAYLGIRKNI